jgi:hypothetical protein
LAATKSIQNLQANLSNPAALAADIAASAAAKADTIASLKANTMLAMLSKPMAAGLAAAMGAALNPALVNNLTKLNIIKAQETDASQEPPGEEEPTDTVRPKDYIPSTPLAETVEPPIAPPPVDKKVYAVELAKFADKVNAAKSAYLKALGIKWKAGDPNPPTADRNKSLDAEVSKTYDKVVGRDGADKDRFAAAAIKNSKPNEADRTEEEKALIKQVADEKEIWYKGDWWVKFLVVQNTYSKLFEQYGLAYDCWRNNGDRFALPAEIEKELKR